MNILHKKTIRTGVIATAAVASLLALAGCGTSDGYDSRSVSVGISSYDSGNYPTRRDWDGDGIPNRYDQDRDGDGVSNRFDWNPNNPNRR